MLKYWISHLKCNHIFTNSEKDNRFEFGIVNNWQIYTGGLRKDTCQIYFKNNIEEVLINIKFIIYIG